MSSSSVRESARLKSATSRMSKLSIKGGGSQTSSAASRLMTAVSNACTSSDFHPALKPSLFPNVPPTLNFVGEGDKGMKLLSGLLSLQYKLIPT